MILYYGNSFRIGLKVLFLKQPHLIESVNFVKPGKGQTFSKLKLRNLLSNQLLEKTFHSTDSLENADVVDLKYIYIYYDHHVWYFMNRNNFDQLSLSKNIINNKSRWLIKQNEYLITFWNENPISIQIDKFVNLKVISDITQQQQNIAMSSTKFKLYTLETGLIIKLPLFIQIGDIVKIDTRTGEYHSRINK